MKVVVAGEIPFVGDVVRLCTEADHDTDLYLVEDFYSAVQSGSAMSEAADVDVAIELHNESAAAKEELLRALGEIIPEDALVLTSALATSTTQAAAWMPNPERVVGFGLLPPVKADGVVELAAGMLTAEAAMDRAVEFWQDLGQEAVLRLQQGITLAVER